MIEDALKILKEKTQTPSVRLDALLCLVDQFEPEFFPLFEEILNDTTEHPDVRSAVALALGKIGESEADEHRSLDILMTQIDVENITVKNYVIQALGMTRKAETASILIEALKDESNTIFASAAESLGLLGKPVVPHLIRLLDEGSDDAQCVAAWKLGELRYVDAIPALIKVIETRSNTDIVALAIWALGEIGYGPQEVINILAWGKAQDKPEIKLRAEMALKKIARHSN